VVLREIDDATVDEYKRASGGAFSAYRYVPMARNTLADGFHRLRRPRRANHYCRCCSSRHQTLIFHSVGANAAHGLSTNADKRRAVETLLRMKNGLTGAIVAKACKVDQRLLPNFDREAPTYKLEVGTR